LIRRIQSETRPAVHEVGKQVQNGVTLEVIHADLKRSVILEVDGGGMGCGQVRPGIRVLETHRQAAGVVRQRDFAQFGRWIVGAKLRRIVRQDAFSG
jgi:hypothetical protein